MDPIGVIGAGAWGTALAVTAQRAGRSVCLWARNPAVARAIAEKGENPDYLPGISFDRIPTSSDPQTVLADAQAVLLVVPAQHLRATCASLAPLWPAHAPGVICAKGIEKSSGLLMNEVAAQELPPTVSIATLSGPTFATEVVRGLPSAVTLACRDNALGQALVNALGSATFRPYLSPDVTGAEIAGAVKNVMAIGCGIIAGRGMGDNARAALLTRGLAEITRLSVAKGGRAETIMGLSGVGDLLLSATSMQSRNCSLGFALGRGDRLSAILDSRKAVTEGVFTAAAVVALAERLKVDMPICSAINAVLHHGMAVDAAIEQLLARPFRSEIDSPPDSPLDSPLA